MTHHSRIGQKRLDPAEDVHIGAAHSDAAYTHQHFIGRGRRYWPLLDGQGAGLLANDHVHHGATHPMLASGYSICETHYHICNRDVA